MIGAIVVTGSTGASPIFCDRFEEESCLVLPRIMLKASGLVTFESGELLIELEKPAIGGGQEVLLVSSAPAILSLPESVTVPESETEVTVPLATGSDFGDVTISASATNHRADSIGVSVTPRTLNFVLAPLIGVGQANMAEIELGRPAPEDGTTISLSSSDEAAVSLSPAQVSIAGGASSASIDVMGVDEGEVVLSATAPGYADATIAVSSIHQLVSIGPVPDLVPGERRSLPVVLSRAAPAGGITVVLESTDPTIALV
ncbi:MAG: hypothetical protein V2J10_12715, partial [Wenzhouxiangella sp.]|nr:hypothetical protein [Wenzhouxiangella sp.]